MGKITGLESMQDVPPKVLLMYEAVEQLIVEGVDIKDIRVSTITDKAGIGKGTAYDYFDTKEDILAYAIVFYMRKKVDELEQIISTKSSFREQVALLLEEAEKGCDKQQCIIRYIHVLTDKQGSSRLVQERLSREEAKACLPIGVFATMLEEGIKRGEVRQDMSLDYMIYVLASRIISYNICFGEGSGVGLKVPGARQLVYQSILDELCEKNV